MNIGNSCIINSRSESANAATDTIWFDDEVSNFEALDTTSGIIVAEVVKDSGAGGIDIAERMIFAVEMTIKINSSVVDTFKV